MTLDVEITPQIRYRYLPLLLQEGHSIDSAEGTIEDSYTKGLEFLTYVNLSGDNPFSTAVMNRPERTEGLIGIIENTSPHEFASYILTLSTVDPGGRDVARVLRYLPVWSSKFCHNANQQLLHALIIGAKKPKALQQFAVYYDMIEEQFPQLSNDVAERLRYRKESLPLQSLLPLEHHLVVHKPDYEFEEIMSTRYVEGATGTCPEMEGRFHEVLFKHTCNQGDVVGIYHQGQLIGALKRLGNPSILGLAAVSNGESMTVVPGGAYITDRPIADEICAVGGEEKYAKVEVGNLRLYPVRYLRQPRMLPYLAKDIEKVKATFGKSKAPILAL